MVLTAYGVLLSADTSLEGSLIIASIRNADWQCLHCKFPLALETVISNLALSLFFFSFFVLFICLFLFFETGSDKDV